MPEGISVGGVTIERETPVKGDKRAHPPPADANAPRGYTWDRSTKTFKPKTTGKILFGTPSPPADEGTHQTSKGPAGGEGQDPAPVWQQPPGRGKKLKFEDVPQNVKDDIAGLGGLVATPLLALIQQVDPYCGGALAANFGNVLDATLPIICRSEKVVKYFSEDKADWLLWGKLAMALAPVGQAVLEHHVFKSVQIVRDDQGNPHAVPRDANGAADHLTPPMPPQEYVA